MTPNNNMRSTEYLNNVERREAIKDAYEQLEEQDKNIIDQAVKNIVDAIKGQSDRAQLSSDGALEILYSIGAVLWKRK